MDAALSFNAVKTIPKNSQTKQPSSISRTLALSLRRRHAVAPSSLHRRLRIITCTESPVPSPELNNRAAAKRLQWPKAAVVGATVVLACALGVARVNNAAPMPMNGVIEKTNTVVNGLSEILLRKSPSSSKSKFVVLSDVFELTMMDSGVPPMLLKMVYDAVTREVPGKNESPGNLLETDGPKKLELGLALVQIYIHQKDYRKAQKICQSILEEHGDMSDPRPHLQNAIICMMLAVKTMLTTDPKDKTSTDVISDFTEEAVASWGKFNEIYEKVTSIPNTKP